MPVNGLLVWKVVKTDGEVLTQFLYELVSSFSMSITWCSLSRKSKPFEVALKITRPLIAFSSRRPVFDNNDRYWVSWLKLRLALNIMWVFELPFLAISTISAIIMSLSRLLDEFSVNSKVTSIHLLDYSSILE
jgi:hypothetical protein